jgi:hypothetical protein
MTGLKILSQHLLFKAPPGVCRTKARALEHCSPDFAALTGQKLDFGFASFYILFVDKKGRLLLSVRI